MSATPYSGPSAPDPITVHDPGDFVAVLPHLLGYIPAPGAIVLVALHDHWVAATGTFDVSMATDAAIEHVDAERVWATFLHATAGSRRSPHPSPDAVWCIAYASPAADQFAAALVALAPRLLAEAIRVHDGTWQPLTCTTPGCCPPRPVPAASDRPALIAPLVAAGSRPLPSQDHLADVLQPGPAQLVTIVAAHLETLTPPVTGQGDFALLAGAHRASADGPPDLSPEQAAVLLNALDDVLVRDRCAAWADDAAWWLWTTLIRFAPPGWAAPVAALIAVTAYQQGNGAMARVAAEHALTDRPRYSMAGLVLELLACDVHPAELTHMITRGVAAIEAAAGHPNPATP